MLSYRLANIRMFERMVREGSHEPIRTPKGIIEPQPDGLRGNDSNQAAWPLGLPPPILRPPAADKQQEKI